MKAMTLKASLLISVITSTSAMAQAGTPACHALVQVANDLYLVNASGVAVTRFTADGEPKHAATLAPDGSKAAFIPDAAPAAFVVRDGAGGRGLFQAAKPAWDAEPDDPNEIGNTASAALIGVAWDGPDTLRLRKHVGKEADRFEFYKVPGNLSAELHQAVPPAVGTLCTVSPRSARTACLHGNDVVMDGEMILSADRDIGGTQQDVLTLRVGGSARVQGVDALQVQVTSIVEGVTLRITLPTGNWMQSRLEPGDFMTVPLDDRTLRVYPTVTNAASGEVRVVVLSNEGGPSVLSAALAWSPGGDSLAVIRTTAAGSVLMLLGPKRPGGWEMRGQVPLGVREQVETLRFVTPTLLFFQTYSQSGLVPIKVTPSAPGGALQLGAIRILPNELAVKVGGTSTKTPVVSWACK